MKLKSGIFLLMLSLTMITELGSGATVGDKSSADHTGTWRVVNGSNNSTQLRFEYTLLISTNAGTLTATLTNVGTVNRSRLDRWNIKGIKLEGGEISFTVTHPFDAGQGIVTWSYKGTITADTIKGKVTKEALGQTNTGSWWAERVRE